MSVLITLMSCTMHLIISNYDFNREVQSIEQNFIAYISRRKAENGGGYLTPRCAGGRGNTTHTPEAGGVKLQSPDSLGKMIC